MSKGRKLIAVLLTVNALLLAAHLWVQVAGTPILARAALAQRQGAPNAGLQRQQMIALLDAIRTSAQDTKTILEKGQIKVTVVPAKPSTGGARSTRKP
jgi:hypothetical protein